MRTNMLVGAGMLLIGGATYFGVMKNSHNQYSKFLREQAGKNSQTMPKDTFIHKRTFDAVPLKLKADTIDFNSVVKELSKIMKK